MNTISIRLINDNQIIEQFSDGKTDSAATSLIRQYQNFVYSTALRFVQNYDDADDLTQEVFIKAIGNIEKFRGDSSLKTWLYRITSNLCMSFLRKKKIKKLFIPGHNETSDDFIMKDSEPEPDKILENNEFTKIFNQFVSKLPAKQRETFVLRYYDDLSYEEISKILKVSVGGLKANYFHAVQKLSRMINESQNK